MSLNETAKVVEAQYSEQLLPHFRGNPLIEALPPSMSDEQLFSYLARSPEFESTQRTWETYHRIQMLGTLSNFTVPLARHFELARSLDSMLRNGYIGRAPFTPEHAKKFRANYSLVKGQGAYLPMSDCSTPQLSSLLMGVSGIGKTSLVKRYFSHLPPVIYHEKFHLYQVTRLHVEMPSDGSSIKGLAAGILHELDQLIPGANYYETYTHRGRAGADTLMRSVARVLNAHCVGFLVADEIQNLTNSKKSSQTVMTELVSACNDLGVPLLFIGTNKAAQVFSLDFRKSRRASGHGISEWTRLPETVGDEEVNEWREFLEILWSFQWTRNPVPLDAQLAETMYYYSQGVIDLAIKLFASAQARAMLEGSETIAAALLADIYNKEMRLLHPMVDALRSNDLDKLMQFEDIAPTSLVEIMNGYARQATVALAKAYSIKSHNKSFEPQLTASLMAAGFGEEESVSAAVNIAEESATTSLAQGLQTAIKRMGPVKRVRSVSGNKASQDSQQIDFESRPFDYRRAVADSHNNNTKVIDQLKALGLLLPLDELVDL
jgi:hypothetical protein